MKFIILILSTLVLTVRLETDIPDQKNADSSTIEKFLNPLRYDTNNRYGANGEQYLSNDDILRKLAGLSYADGDNGMQFSRAEVKLFSGEYGGDYTDENSLRNLGLQYNNIYGYLNSQNRQQNDYDLYKSYRAGRRNQELLRNLARLYDLENEGYRDDLLRYASGQSYNDYRREYIRNQSLSRYNLYNQLLRSINFEPDHIGYVGLLPKRYKGRYNNFALIGTHQLGFDGRTYNGLRSPITPGILDVAGRRNFKGYRQNGYSSQ